jgi:hypothetical protein
MRSAGIPPIGTRSQDSVLNKSGFAKALGLAVPLHLQQLADELIE